MSRADKARRRDLARNRDLERNQQGAFIARYPSKCWYCGKEAQGTECAFAEDVLVHAGCRTLMNYDLLRCTHAQSASTLEPAPALWSGSA